MVASQKIQKLNFRMSWGGSDTSKGWADFPLNSVLSTLKSERTRRASAFRALKFGLCEVRDDSLKRQ